MADEATVTEAEAVAGLGELSGVEEAAEKPEGEVEKPEGEVEKPEGEKPEGEVEKPEGEVEKPEGEDEKPEDSEGDKPHRDRGAEARIAELTAARKTAEEKVVELEARTARLEASVSGQVGIHPDLLTKEEADVIRQANALEGEERRLRELPDGERYEDEKDASKNLNPGEVRRRLTEIGQQLRRVAPRADELFEKKAALQARAIKIGLKAMRDAQAASMRAQEKPRVNPPKPGAPARPAAAAAAAPAGRRGQDESEFKREGGDRTAAARQLAKIAGV